MKPIESSWLLYSDAGIPGWLTAIIFAAAVYLSLRWLKAEKRRTGIAGALLPYTWILLLALVAWLIWKPVLIRVLRWQHDGRSLVYLDSSRSMDTPVMGKDLSQSLSLLTLWEPAACEHRITAPDALRHAVTSAALAGRKLYQAIEKRQQEALQGVPPDTNESQLLSAGRSWLMKINVGLAPSVYELEEQIAKLNLEQTPQLNDAVKSIATFAGHVDHLGARTDQLSHGQIATVVPLMQKLLDAMGKIVPHLSVLQTAFDQEFYSRNEENLRPLLDQFTSKTRRDLAAHVLKKSNNDHLQIVNLKNSTPEQTDIYGTVKQLLAGHADEVISNLVLLSDGGHNSDGENDVAEKLKKAGIDVLTVGIGAEQLHYDLAVLDWRTRRIARAGRETGLRVRLKTPEQIQVRFRLILNAGEKELASAMFTTSGDREEQVEMRFKAPEAGRHTLTLTIADDDANRENNSVQFVLDTVRRMPKVLILGDQPNWDSSYIFLALERVGFEVRQIFHGISRNRPKRGASSTSIPVKLEHWSKYAAVILQGKPFAGYGETDAAALFRYVAENGGSLVVLSRPGESYLDALAAKFQLTDTAVTANALDHHLVMAPGAGVVPFMRVGVDGPQSARILAALGRCQGVTTVHPQNRVLLQNRVNVPIFSLGFYGKGKMYLWGLRGLHALRDFGKADHVDQFLMQLLEDAAAPLFSGDRKIAAYPPLPVAGKPNILISLAADDSIYMGESTSATALREGLLNRYATLVPPAAGPLTVRQQDNEVRFTAVNNPSLETLFFEFNETFLQQFARDAGGRHVALEDGAEALKQLRPRPWQSATSERYPLAEHWLLMCLLAAVGALHWALRKLSGLAI